MNNYQANIVNENIKFTPYCKEKHQELLETMKKEVSLAKYLNRDNNLYILDCFGMSIGYMYLDKLSYKPSSITITMGIIESLQNKGLGSYLLSNISNYLIESSLCDSIILELEPADKRTRRVAINAGYQYDALLAEKFYMEDYHEEPYIKRRTNNK